MTIYSLGVLLFLFGTSLLFHVQFLLLLPDLHIGFSRGRSGGLVCPSLSEFSAVYCDPHSQGFGIVNKAEIDVFWNSLAFSMIQWKLAIWSLVPLPFPSSQVYGFFSGHVWMWELDCEENWAPTNCCFWTVVLENTLEVPWTARRSNQSILTEISPGCPLEGLMVKLKLQYFGHLMWKVDSLQKALMLGGIGGRRRRGQQRMKWLVNLGKLQVLVMDREAWHAATHGVTKSRIRCSDRTELSCCCCC